MPTNDEWLKIFDVNCESHNKQWGAYAWEKSDFDVNIGEEMCRDYCYQDYSNFTLCDSCTQNIADFNESKIDKTKLKAKIKKIEKFLHNKFPEFDISDDDE
jgi:hypothetical protein